MDARLYLDLAKKLVEEVKAGRFLVVNGAGESECRAAISRAYYAAYNGAVSFLGLVGLVPGKSHEGHLVLREILNNSGNEDLRRAGRILDSLHTERKSADYYLNDRRAESIRQAESVVRNAEEVFKLLDQVIAEPPALRGAIATAVHAYVQQRQTEAFRPKSSTGK
jgi:uncharacterized protein (UPF0332 family)